MRLPALLLSLVLAATAAAQSVPLSLKVLDPRSAAVSGARVTLYRGDHAAAIRSTAADGAALFTGIAPGEYRVEVLAPGFRPAQATAVLPSQSGLTITLAVAAPPETVVVTAARTPLSTEDAGAPAVSLDALELELLNPVAAADVLRFLPGAVVNSNGRRGGLSSLFVRGGDSRYNKVIVDGVTINEPGGTFDFGVVPMHAVERLEFVRGAASTLYGSDAMTSVVQLWTLTGRTRTPEFRLGADAGNFSTGNAYASLAGALSRLDYSLFAEHFLTGGQGVNDQYWNTAQGGNLGVELSPRASLRVRARHSNNRSEVQSFWKFNGQPLLPPDRDQFARQNNFLASAELRLAAPAQWQHRFTGFEYHHKRTNVDNEAERGCAAPLFLDCPFSDLFQVNRAGFDYQGEYAPRGWARTVFGYLYENENGRVDQDFSGFELRTDRALRQNHGLFAQQALVWERVSLIGGLRYENNDSFGNRVVPRVAGSVVVVRGHEVFSGTRLRAAYGEGIKEPRLEESFGVLGAFGPVIIPNPDLKAEENRSWEAGVEQQLFGGRYSLGANYFDNLFRNQIAFSFDPNTFVSQYVNVNRAQARGMELEFHGRPAQRLRLDAAYTLLSTEVLEAPFAFDPLLAPGAPLIRRPRHSGSLLVNWFGSRWGASLAGSFVGRRPDSDFLGLGVTHAAGYARFDLGGWYALTPRVSAYLNAGNLLNRKYEEAAGYPALGANFRAGVRFRIGGD